MYLCKGITLIEVPYWWDRTYDSLASTVYNKRPDLFDTEPQGEPISSSPPVLKSKDPKKGRKYSFSLLKIKMFL